MGVATARLEPRRRAPAVDGSSLGGTADGLTPAQLAGQRLIYSYAGLQPPPSLLAAIRTGEAAGVVFYGDNITSIAQIRAVVQRLQRFARAAAGHVPLLMITDQEGGAVRRLPGPPYAFPRSVGSSRDAVRAAADTGAAAARTLRGAGIDVNLAPVLDVARRAGNPIGFYGRSYSSRAGVVATLGAAFIRAQQRGGVAAAAKHFPGLGTAGSGQDTDLRPVTLTATSPTLRAVDERPYRAALAVGDRLVMLSWARYPALDPGHVAGLSSRIINGELRGRLGFTGVTITDGIVAGAVSTSGDVATRAVAAARAGEDLIVCAAGPQSPAVAAQAQAGLRRAIASGRISRAAARAVGRADPHAARSSLSASARPIRRRTWRRVRTVRPRPRTTSRTWTQVSAACRARPNQ